MVRKDDTARETSARNRAREETTQQHNSSYQETRSYKLIKEEQIEKSQQRANFLGASESVRIPKSPRPFREHGAKQEDSQCSCGKGNTSFSCNEIPFNTITDLISNKKNKDEAVSTHSDDLETHCQETAVASKFGGVG